MFSAMVVMKLQATGFATGSAAGSAAGSVTRYVIVMLAVVLVSLVVYKLTSPPTDSAIWLKRARVEWQNGNDQLGNQYFMEFERLHPVRPTY